MPSDFALDSLPLRPVAVSNFKSSAQEKLFLCLVLNF